MKKNYNVKIQSKNDELKRNFVKSRLIRFLMILPVLSLGIPLSAQDCGTGETITWDEDQNISGTFELAHEDILLILPGVNVVFETAESMLVINGTILAEGTQEMPVTFSGISPDGWSGINLQDACPSTFVYCEFSGLSRNAVKTGDLRAESAIDISGTDDVKFEFCTFTGNTDGIGINNSTGVVMTSCTFSNNEIEPGQKGLIYIEGSSSDTIRNCSFVNNKTNLRGIISVNNGSHAVIQNNSFAQTQFFEPPFNGSLYPVIYMSQSDSPNLLIVNGNEFTGNRAPQNNRLAEISIFGNQDDIDHSNALIWNNSFTGYPFPLPGQTPKTAIRANFSVLTITHNNIRYYNRAGVELRVSEAKINLNTFEANRTTMGAVFIDEYQNYTGRLINNVIFANYFLNNRAPNGAAITSVVLPNEGIHTTVDMNTFTGNTTTEEGGKGGAIYDYYGSRLTVKNNLFGQNTATNGGAVCIETNGWNEIVETKFKNNTFLENEATGAGGAVFAARSMVGFEGNTIRNNQALIGAGIYVDGLADAKFAAELRDGHVSFTDNIIAENFYGQAGGGCYLLNCQDAEMVRNLISYNEPSIATGDQFGGGLYVVNSNLQSYNNHFIENVAGEDFGGLYLSFGPSNSLWFYNCNVTGHQQSGGLVFSNPVTTENIQVYNSLFYENNLSATGKAVIYTGPDPLDLYNCYFDILPNTYDLNFEDELVATVPGWTEPGIYYLDCDNSVCVDSGNANEIFNDLPGANPPEVLFPSCGTVINDIGISGGPYALDVPELFIPEVPVDKENLTAGRQQKQGSTGLGSSTLDPLVIVYPNPTSGLITIETGSTAEMIKLSVSDAFGRLVREFDTPVPGSQWRMDLSGQPAGLYIMKLVSAEQSITKTIILR